MVTTRGGTETSSPPLSRKRAPQEDNASSPEAKRRKPAVTKAVTTADVVIRTKTDLEPETAKLETSLLAERKHIRFSSTSPPPQQASSPPIPPPETKIIEEHVDESDDDAAPEDIPKSVAQEQALAKQAVTTKAIQQQKTAKKLRRRKRDRKLKEQAEGSDKRKETVVEKEEENEEKEDVQEHLAPSHEKEPQQGPKKFSLDNIPALLPDELLATEAPIRPPTPPPTTFQHQQNLKKSLMPFDISTAPLRIPQSKPPKDLTVGAFKVRVVAAVNTRLPPKSNKSTMMARSTLLKGRAEIAAKSMGKKQSARDGSKVQRRSVGGFNRGFV
jgi:U3 small nucleolar RNA-associated protein 16